MAKLEQSVIRDGLDDNEGNKISDAFFQAEAKISENVQKRYWGPEKALMIVFVAGVLTLLSLLMLFAWPPTHPKKPNQESKI